MKSPRLMSILVPVWGFERTFVTLEYIFNLVYLRLLYLNLNKIFISWAICTNLYKLTNLHQFLLVGQSAPNFVNWPICANFIIWPICKNSYYLTNLLQFILIDQSAPILLYDQSVKTLIIWPICYNFYQLTNLHQLFLAKNLHKFLLVIILHLFMLVHQLHNESVSTFSSPKIRWKVLNYIPCIYIPCIYIPCI